MILNFKFHFSELVLPLHLFSMSFATMFEINVGHSFVQIDGLKTGRYLCSILLRHMQDALKKIRGRYLLRGTLVDQYQINVSQVPIFSFLLFKI
jgi:hypothetical protein